MSVRPRQFLDPQGTGDWRKRDKPAPYTVSICAEKVRFRNKAEAITKMRQHSVRKTVYLCQQCSFWHIGGSDRLGRLAKLAKKKKQQSKKMPSRW